MLDTLWQDTRHAARSLRGTPGFTLAAVATLALGIGANTAIFSLVDGLILRTLPVSEPHRLVMVVDTGQAQGAGFAESWSNPVWEQLRERLDRFGGGFAWAATRFNLAAGGEARVVPGLWASGAFFDTLGVAPHVGRLFTTADDARGGGLDGPVAVISHDFWQRHFGGSRDAIGSTLTIRGVRFTVLGVTPPGFFGPDVGRTFDVVLPLGTEPLLLGSDASALDLRGRNWLRIMLRLAPGQTIDAATGVLRGFQTQIREATRPDLPGERMVAFMRAPMALVPASHGWSLLRTRFQQPLLIVMGVVALVLLIACANITNLMLARAAARSHEVGIRRALGASRVRLLRQLLVESLLLAGIGAALGLLFAHWTTRVLVAQLSTDANEVFLHLTLDGRVLGFTMSVAVVTALICGTLPAWRASRTRESLYQPARESSENTRSRVAGTLVAVQVAFSLVLVVAAGLFTRTFIALASRDIGFTTERMLIVNVTTPMTHFKAEDLTALYERVLEAVAAVRGVERAALSDVTPTSGVARNAPVIVPGVELAESERLAFVNVVSRDWFATYGATLIAGRDFGRQDREGTPRVGIVNEAFVRRFLGGENPIGRTIRDGFGSGTPIEIVGYARDAVYRSLREPAPPTLYTAFAQRPLARPFVSITVRASTDAPGTLTRTLAASIATVSPELDLRFRPLADQVGAQLAQERVVAMLAAFFGAVALLLAALGLYGVTTQAVSRRRGEIGIRMALGAEYGVIVRMVLRGVATFLVAGIAAGLVLSWWASRFVAATLLYGLEPRDSTTFVSAAAILVPVGIVAGWIPARRAALLNPLEALRAE